MKPAEPERFQASTGGAPPSEPHVPAGPTEPFGYRQSPERRTRRTVDLSTAQHRGLDIWQREAADRLGRARVTGQEVLSALVDQLLSDSKLSIQIIRNIQARR
ncbi:MAG TPA: hypothetical protein VF299_03945 [Mycobacterium sp.]